MNARLIWSVLVFLSAQVAIAQAPPTGDVGPARAVEPRDDAAPTADGASPDPPLDAYDAMDKGNRLLKNGAPEDALPLYEHAAELEPDAREIAFAKGLSHYHLDEYERARGYFEEASLGHTDALADDALYSAGAAYHAEALAAMDDPKTAVSRFESAMQRYQSVLANDPNHEAARDAHYKAGQAWRQIKQMMKQQQQQQQDSDEDSEQNEQQQQDGQKQEQQDQQNEQQSREQQQESSDEQKQQQNQQQSADEQQDKQQQASENQQDESQQQPEPQQAQMTEQEVSREQAERKLREMMQAQRQRQKRRDKQRVPVRVRPAEKDW